MVSTRITKGSLVGLLAGVGLGVIFPPLGAPLVIAGALGGAAIGRALDEKEDDSEESGSSEPLPEGTPKPAEGLEAAGHLLDRFDRLARQMEGSPPESEQGDPSDQVVTPESTGESRGGPERPAGSKKAHRTSPAASLYEQVAAAESLLQSGRFLEAIDRFRDLKETLLQATSGAGQSDRQRVIEGLKMALHRLAGVLIENDSAAEAEDLLKEALELSEDHLDTLLHLARLQIMLSRPLDAEPYLLRAIEEYPDNAEAYRLLGDVYVEAGQVEAAKNLYRRVAASEEDGALKIEMLERIAGLDSTDPTPLLELGRAHAAEANWDEAARAFRQALSRAPEDQEIRRRLGAASFHIGKAEEGVSLLADADGDDIDGVVQLGHYFAVNGDDSRAIAFLRRFRVMDRSLSAMDPALRRSRLRRLGLEGDQVEAIFAPIRFQGLLDFALVETRAGDIDEAAAAAREAIAYGGSKIGSDAVRTASALASEFERQGRNREAAEWAAETVHLGGSLEKISEERDSYEDFLRRFKFGSRDLVGEGGMARVYRGTDTRTGRTVAIKRMHDRFCTDSQAVAYFYREVRAIEELSRPYPHPNVVEFIASGITESRFIFAMEFVDGPGLRDVMDRGDPYSLEELCTLFEGICSGLDRAHNSVRHIIHRDLKPENILLDSAGAPKLTDFGICRVSSLYSASRRYYGSTRSFVGTSLYSAPEQYPDAFSGQVPTIDARADLYSVGCILYEMLTTQPPFVSDEPGLIGLMHQRRPIPASGQVQQLPPPSERNPLAMARFSAAQRDRLDAISMRCLELKPARRYRTAIDLYNEIETLRSV